MVRLRGELLVCTSTDLMSLAWRNTRNGELEGLDTDMARAFSARLGVRPVFVETTPETMLPALEGGRCDVAMGGVGITPGRAARVAFTKPYLTGPMAAVTSRSSIRVRTWPDMDRHGVVVAVAAGTIAEELIRDHLRIAEIAVVRAPQTQEQEILSGRADVFVTDTPYARRLRDDDSWRVMDAPRSLGETLYAYAVPRGDAAWLAEVNGFLAGVKSDGTLARSAQRWAVTGMLTP
ncbi:substrate-binding periplasmic protein [Muricoccus radiodurans]|uniref:substrate-binding periplasmic protein n=1 Tax=Muricoccus radiodurans TaxID=2231721 RepID=UPI003CECB5FB